MIITKRQLRRIIREEIDTSRMPTRTGPGGEKQTHAPWPKIEPSRRSDLLSKIEAAVQEVVDSGGGLFAVATVLGKPPYGIKADTMTSPLPMVLVQSGGKKYAVLNVKYADDPDAVVGPYAIGVLG